MAPPQGPDREEDAARAQPAAPPSAPAPPSATTAAAFFDFDHTLLHGDAGVIFGRTLAEWVYSRGIHLTGKDWHRHVAAASSRIAGTVGKAMVYRALNALGIVKRSQLIERTYRFLEGLPAEEMSRRMERVWNDRIQQRLYPRMVQVINEHRKAGRRIVIVTTGMRELVGHSRKALGEDIEIIGVEMEVDQAGLWRGTVTGPLYGVHKAEAVKAWAAKNGVDLSESWAYSDHFSDAAFLEAVGHPVAVNPGVRLRLLARRKGWPVVNVLPPTRYGQE